jgi:hypothetical protein
VFFVSVFGVIALDRESIVAIPNAWITIRSPVRKQRVDPADRPVSPF